MLYIPVLGRMSLGDYMRLIFAFFILIAEPVLRFIFWALPLRWLADFVRSKLTHEPPATIPFLASQVVDQRTEKHLLTLSTTEDFVSHWEFPFQTHYVTTKDGYILTLHRIPSSKAESKAAHSPTSHFQATQTSECETSPNESSNSGSTPLNNGNRTSNSGSINRTAYAPKPVVLLWHGFLMCSEVWVCTPDPKGSLALTLAEAGYDVWLGNTRGNKYSCKHRKLRPTDEEFWNFSMDQLALCDLPDSVDYILRLTGVPSLSYIGFSQGTAQCFSALSLNQQLNSQINLFLALAPATKPHGLENKTIDSLVHVSPEVIYLLFGRKALLSSALFWQSILTPSTFAWVIDFACHFLFGWKSDYMDSKPIVYRHLYSYSAVKIVVHWFQIMKTGRFQMYDDHPPMMPNAVEGYHVPRYPTSQIQTPIAIIYGGEDTLPDMDYIIKNIQAPKFVLKIQVIIPAVLGLLAEHSQIRADSSSQSSIAESFDSSSDTAVDEKNPLIRPKLRLHGYPTSSLADVPTVPWIALDEIRQMMHLGKQVVRYEGYESTLGRGSCISIQAVLESVARHMQEFPSDITRFVEIKPQGPAISTRLSQSHFTISDNLLYADCTESFE
ncbi:hypothetical protein BSLG_005292 [Batrachochytrium salamandrivorans]|nr:hypothetical protein BSLG_005292 [Batrachochytrium salamandrivorans]